MQEDLMEGLVRWLTTPQGYNRQSPLAEAIDKQSRVMVAAIAAEVMESVPELAETIETRVRTLVTEMMRSDALLTQQVTDAVARALASRRIEGTD